MVKYTRPTECTAFPHAYNHVTQSARAKSIERHAQPLEGPLLKSRAGHLGYQAKAHEISCILYSVLLAHGRGVQGGPPQSSTRFVISDIPIITSSLFAYGYTLHVA